MIQWNRVAVMLAAGLAAGYLAATSLAAPQPGTAPDLNTCAAIETQADRLACYDKLAGRKPAEARAPAAASQSASHAAATAPPATDPHSAAAPSSPSVTAPNSAAAPPPPATSSPPAQGRTSAPNPAATSNMSVPAPDSKEAFGLYAAEHPTASKRSSIDSITAKVVSLSYDRYGKETVSLEGGPVWQLAGSDALLGSGDSVTIKRAALGSYVMTTPSGRVHRVRRLR